MPIAALLPFAFFVHDLLPTAAPAARSTAVTAQIVANTAVAPTAKLAASWQADILVLTGLERGRSIRVYDVVGHVLAEFRSESPEARLRLEERQLVAVCAGGECVGAR